MSLDDSMLGESISCSIQSSSQPDMSDATWHHRTSSFHSAESDEAYGSDKSGINQAKFREISKFSFFSLKCHFQGKNIDNN